LEEALLESEDKEDAAAAKLLRREQSVLRFLAVEPVKQMDF